MSFTPIIPFAGYAGWSFLQRSLSAQKEAFEAAPVLQNDTAYFKEKIADVQTAEDLVGDYRLLKVALGAFGLEEDIGNRAFIKKVLEEGSLDSESFANGLVDKSYLALTKAFGFDLGTPNTQLSDFAGKVVEKYTERQFEVAVGEQDNDMRLALALERDLGAIVGSSNTADGKWYSVLGDESLLTVFQTALNIPRDSSSLDLDSQVEYLRERTAAVFGDSEIDQFSDPERRDELNRLFLVRSQINSLSSGMSSGAIALTLLQSI